MVCCLPSGPCSKASQQRQALGRQPPPERLSSKIKQIRTSMSTHPRSPSRTRSYAAWLRRGGPWSGMELFAYVTTHLANHALVLVSFTALEAGRGWFLLLWRNPLGTALLYGALASHLVLALWALYQD